jgi:hypothetical protein
MLYFLVYGLLEGLKIAYLNAIKMIDGGGKDTRIGRGDFNLVSIFVCNFQKVHLRRLFHSFCLTN